MAWVGLALPPWLSGGAAGRPQRTPACAAEPAARAGPAAAAAALTNTSGLGKGARTGAFPRRDPRRRPISRFSRAAAARERGNAVPQRPDTTRERCPPSPERVTQRRRLWDVPRPAPLAPPPPQPPALGPGRAGVRVGAGGSVPAGRSPGRREPVRGRHVPGLRGRREETRGARAEGARAAPTRHQRARFPPAGRARAPPPAPPYLLV